MESYSRGNNNKSSSDDLGELKQELADLLELINMSSKQGFKKVANKRDF